MSGSFIPALRFHFLTPLFDPFMAYALPDTKIKRDLVTKAGFSDGMRVLDFGCGTATLTVLIKRNALREIFRVLAPGDEVYVADFDRARSLLRRAAFDVIRLTDGRRNTRANAEGTVRAMIAAAGFKNVVETSRHPTVIGDVSCIRGERALL